MKNDVCTMYIKNLPFDDIYYHSKALDSWKQEYNQLSEKPFRSCLQDLDFWGFRIFREQMNCRVAQCTRTPPNTVNILIPIQLLSIKDNLPTHTLCINGATLLPSESDFFFCTPPDADYMVISLQQSILEKRLIDQDIEKILKKRFGCGIFLNTKISEQLTQKCAFIIKKYTQSNTLPDLNIQQQLCDEIIDLVLHYFDISENIPQTKDLGSNHHHIVQYVYDRVQESENNLTVLDLCKELQIPHRSLHYAFEKTTGISPNKYIRAIRLNAADRIIHKQSNKLLLTDLAYRYGFSHSSHFGREYKKLFGRIPSKVQLMSNHLT